VRSIQPPEFRSEYAWIMPVVDDNGVFEYDPEKLWAEAYAVARPGWDAEQVKAVLDEFVRVGLLLKYEAEGKTWCYLVGSDKPGHLPSPSHRNSKSPLPPTKTTPSQSLEAAYDVAGDSLLGTGTGTGNGTGNGTGRGNGTGTGTGTVPVPVSLHPSDEKDESNNKDKSNSKDNSNSKSNSPGEVSPVPTPEQVAEFDSVWHDLAPGKPTIKEEINTLLRRTPNFNLEEERHYLRFVHRISNYWPERIMTIDDYRKARSEIVVQATNYYEKQRAGLAKRAARNAKRQYLDIPSGTASDSAASTDNTEDFDSWRFEEAADDDSEEL
jgi:hypothetical protein